MPNNPISTPEFTPFISGCGFCKPSTDYYSQQYGGIGNYSNDGLIPQSNGKNLFKARNFEQPLNKEFIKNNYGIDYKTSFGGSKKKSIKKLKGGTESGATPMNQRFFDPDAHIDDYPPLSGKGVMSAYGPIDPSDIGTGSLAPYTTSDCTNANYNTDLKTGGNKTKKESKNKLEKVKEKEKSKKMNIKKLKGGTESGATPMNQRFFDPNAHIDDYPPLSGKGVMSAYGPIDPSDIGTGSLAPYTTSDCTNANYNTDLKTGGYKKSNSKNMKKQSIKKGSGLIPYVSSDGVDGVGMKLDNAITKFTDFLQTLDQDYVKSAKVVESVKIGNQRLIQGGKKDIKKKVEKDIKKEVKKDIKKVARTKRGGSIGSDFALTLNSRGPSNAPDDFWGVPGEEWFRQFNKTGDYIPNSQLQYAATPLLAGKGDSNVVSGYNNADLNYAFEY